MKAIKRLTVFEVKQDNSQASNSFRAPDKAGYLNTLTGSSSFLSRPKWKKRYYVLTSTHLHRFKKLEDAISERHSERKIALEHYDVCQRDESESFKKDFVFVLDGALGDVQQPRYVFAADSSAEMQEWINQLRTTLSRLRQSKTTKPKRPPRSKATSPSTSSSQSKSECKDGGSVGDASASCTRLYNPTKFRVRGPKGRRLPQKKKRLKDEGDKYRSNSLCEFDISDSNDEISPDGKNGVDGQHKNGGPGQRDESDKKKLKSTSSDNLAYRYSSSSEDSLDVWNNDGRKRTSSVEEKAKMAEGGSNMAATVVTVEDEAKNHATVNIEGAEGKTVELDISLGKSEPASEPKSPSEKATGPLIFTSAKLLEQNAGLSRMRKQLSDDLASVTTNLTMIKKKLLEIPEDYTLAEAVTSQATLALTDLKSAEEEVKKLTPIVVSIQKSLDLAQQKCENILKELSSG